MARQKGILKLIGSISDLNFYRTGDGYFARSKSSLTRQRIQEDPAFERTRESNSEFGAVSKDTTIFEQLTAGFSADVPKSGLRRRLMSLFMAIKKHDMTHVHGERTVTAGLLHPAGLSLLRGFQYNRSVSLESVLALPPAVDWSNCSLSLDGLVPATGVKGPPGATHVCLAGCFARIDFTGHSFERSFSAPVILPTGAISRQDVVLRHAAFPEGPGLRLCVLKVTFLQQTGFTLYPLGDGKHNVMKVVGLAC